MLYTDYNFKELEPQILKFWEKKKVVDKQRTKNKKKPRFYFLQGPPYTSGRVHLGTAWNMSLKDMVLRYKRMKGFNVWDRMGYDMHGLPTEQKVMAKLNLKNKEDIEAYGLKKFTQECEKFCKDMMVQMNQDFIHLGATLDFSDPYQPIKKEFMEAEWWLIKKAHEKGRLYQGLRTMHWDAATQSSVAKHELEYKQVTDTSIYMKFPHAEKKNTFFIIWTTTPWTIPLNLAIMVNPELEYVEAEVSGEHWIVSKDLAQSVIHKAGFDNFKILKTMTGKMLEGQHYRHPLQIAEHLPKDLQKNPRLYSVLLSTEYVDATSGTGLVHCAPGCGPEDYEVGHFYHIPPFNCVNEEGIFANLGQFTGWRAKQDDKKFIQAIDDSGSLLAKENYVHEYPHGERSHQPVIFRTTKQWFFKVEDLKEKMLTANEKVYWHPQGGKNAFTSWLENLRDNSITKQRYWGTPVPIWQAKDGDYLVIGNVEELEKLSKQKVKQMHIPDIDTITITKNGKEYQRIPDVLDVWIDAGTVSWNCLDYPSKQKNFTELFPPDFILEGKDQIRGWFNLLMVTSFLAFDKPAFKKVYMHGFLNDVSGVKMSKSLGNIISPDELIQKHGTDVLRYYMCETNAGEDVNFSWDECTQKGRYLLIIWNMHKLLLNLAAENKINPYKLDGKRIERVLGIEEQYILSRLHSTIKSVSELMESYKLDQTIAPIEKLFLDTSRIYIQMVREKSTVGEDDEKELVLYTLGQIVLETVKMFSIIAPFISEAIYQNLKEEFGLKELSVSHWSWPEFNTHLINTTLENQVELGLQITQAALNAREKAKLGLRWPVLEIVIASRSYEVKEAVAKVSALLKKQVNAKSVRVVDELPKVTFKLKPDFGKIGPAFGEKSPLVITRLTTDSPQTVMNHIEQDNYYAFKIDDKEVRITRDMIIVEQIVPAPYLAAECKFGYVYLNTERTAVLEAEGYSREFARNVQQLRKDAGLQKTDGIKLVVKSSDVFQKMLQQFHIDVEQKIGAESLKFADTAKMPLGGTFTIKKESMQVWFEKAS